MQAAMASDEWEFPSAVHYYDARTDIVERSARQLEQLNDDEIDAALNVVAGA